MGAGEPLNPEVIEKVRQAWGLTIRDGFGQTETVLVIGNFPGQTVKPGAAGVPLPGITSFCWTPRGTKPTDGEICLRLDPAPISLMAGYVDDPERTASVMEGGYYHTGDIASRDADGYYTYVGRSDDVFKSSDYRLSPFELESALIEHPAIAEAAVVPAPDAIRWNVPKAYITLKPGVIRPRRWRKRFSCSSANAWGPTSEFAASNFPSCPRPSPARFAARNCARRRKPSGRWSQGASSNIGRRIFRS